MADSPLQVDTTYAGAVFCPPLDACPLPAIGGADLADSLGWQQRLAGFYDRTHSTKQPARPHYYYRRIQRRLAGIVQPHARVLDIGCGDGTLLASLRPSHGVGIDLNRKTVQTAERRHSGLTFMHMRGEDVHRLGEKFDYVVLCQALGEIYDLSALFRSVQGVCHARTRLVIVHWSRLWQPALKIAEWAGLKSPSPDQNWIPADELRHLLELSGFQTIRTLGMTIAPLWVPLVSDAINRFVANLPFIHLLGLTHVIVARSVDPAVLGAERPKSVSIVVPARNESGHIEPLLKRIPRLAPKQEVIFVEGHSTDDTWKAIQRTVAAYRGPFQLQAMRQEGQGKGDAVRKGFAAASGEVLMILDADISVPPEELPAFYEALASGQGEFINGSRMVYLMDRRAMRFLNLLGNKFFGFAFTYLLSQRFRDTLCGTKVLRRDDYRRIAEHRSYFGDFDPFGDFDLLFGAARLDLKIIDVPVHYKARTYGQTNISRFRHGLVLLRMCLFAAKKLKLV